MDIGTVVATADIDKGPIADGKWATRIIRHRGPRPPGAGALFVNVDRGTDRVIPARGNDAGVVHRRTVEPQSGHVHVRTNAPTVRNRVVPLRGRGGHGEGSPTAK